MSVGAKPQPATIERPTKNQPTAKRTPMPNLTLPTDEQSQKAMIYIIGATLLAGIAHVGKLLIENKPVPLRQALGSCILTMCVGGASGAMLTSYWHLPGPIVASAVIVAGFVGGPVTLGIAGKLAERTIKNKAEDFIGALEEKDAPE